MTDKQETSTLLRAPARTPGWAFLEVDGMHFVINGKQPKRHTLRFRSLHLDWQLSKDSWGEYSGDKYVISYFQISKVIRDNGQFIFRLVLWRLHIAWGLVTHNAKSEGAEPLLAKLPLD